MTTVPVAAGVIGLRVPGVITYRHLALRIVSTACKMALEASQDPAANDFEAEVVSAFGEAFNNIAIHSYSGVSPEPVQIEVDWDDEKMVITSIDTGHAFDPGCVASLDLDALNEHGMGLFIMRSCMDHVEYWPGPPNVLRLVKLRSRAEGALPPPPSSGEGRGSPMVPPGAGPVYDGMAGGSVSRAAAIPLADLQGVRGEALMSTGSSGVQRIALDTWSQDSVDRIRESARRR